jgi:purine-cytosine permease-like protein
MKTSKGEEELIIIQNPPKKPKVLGIELVPDVANVGRWWSMRWLIAGAIAEALPVVWVRIPADWAGPMPEWLKVGLGYFVLTALLAAAVSRVVQQQGLQR